jgi:hypothetical protein
MKLALAIVAGGVPLSVSAQGTFQNLDFEQANPMPVIGSPYFPYLVTAASAFPGWTVGGSEPEGSGPFVLYNDETLGSPAVDLIGTGDEFGPAPLQGSYSVLLQYFDGTGINFEPPTLSQTGMIPANAQSINFWVSPIPGFSSDGIVELNGNPIPLFPAGGGRLAGNISAWSGQTVQLTFTTPSTGVDFFYFDDITFSPTTITPEPSPLVLTGIGSILFVLYRRFVTKPR